jgi:hypothetical protein
VFRAPPGSESGACIPRGDSGTWESQWFPCVKSGTGVSTRGEDSRRGEEALASHTSLGVQGTQSKRRDTRSRGRRGRPERPRDGPLAVVADHSVCLAAHTSGGLKSHATRGPGLRSKRGGNASLAEGREGFGRQGASREGGSEGLAEHHRVVIKGGPPRGWNRSAKDGAWSSLHDGGAGAWIPPRRTTVCAGATVAKTCV